MLTSDRLSYERALGFDEAVDAQCQPRPHYAALFEEMARLSAAELASRERLRDAIFQRLGITFAVYGDAGGLERTWPMDLVPRIIPAGEWAIVERGLAQRVKALNLFLDDLYTGEAAALRDGIVPRRLVLSSEGFVRAAVGIRVPHGARCLVAGIDLVRDADGTYRVLEDNLRVPSGISYVLENRAARRRLEPAGGRADPRHLQLGVLRTCLPGAPARGGARRGPRPARPRHHRLHADDVGAAARGCHLPARG